MAVSTILFDLGDVLVTEHYDRPAKRLAKINGLSIEKNMQVTRLDMDYMLGKISPKEFAEKHIKELKLCISEKEFHRIYADRFSLNKEVLELVEKLKGKFNLVMVSDVEKVTIEFLEKAFPELFALFGHKVYSCHVGMLKPGKEIFLYGLSLAKAKPGEAVFVDDKQENVEAAKKLGIMAIRFKTAKGLERDLKKIGLI